MIGFAAYLDASAFVKTIDREDESEALAALLRAWPHMISSALLRTETVRAARRLGQAGIERANSALERVELVAFTDGLAERASFIEPVSVRTLDAIHLATADAVRERVGVLITYDQRMIDGAELLGLPVSSPS